MTSKKLAILALVLLAPVAGLASSAEQDAILEELLAGNAAYVSGATVTPEQISQAVRTEQLEGQTPKAIVLSCADSRVPVEHVFRQGIGDLFVVRLAGNVPMKFGGTIASVEYAIEHVKTPKVLVVLGHQKCGAVASTYDVHQSPAAMATLTPELRALVGEIAPAVSAALAANPGADRGAAIEAAVHENADLAAKHLLERSPLIREAVEKGEVLLVVGYYHLDSGKVDLEVFE